MKTKLQQIEDLIDLGLSLADTPGTEPQMHQINREIEALLRDAIAQKLTSKLPQWAATKLQNAIMQLNSK